MSKAPAFQFYAGDFLVGTMGMPNEDVGIYIKLLAFQWERGSVPADDAAIRMLVGARRAISPAVMAKFELSEDGNLRNARLEQERQKQADFRASRSANAAKRWESTSNARASKLHPGSTSETHALQSSSSSSSSKNIPPKPPRRPGKDRTPTTEPAKRIASLFSRRLTTPWSEKEVKAFKALGEISADDLDAVERYYTTERAKGQEAGRHRRDLLTFLNHFPGEVDRARAKQPRPCAPGYSPIEAMRKRALAYGADTFRAWMREQYGPLAEGNDDLTTTTKEGAIAEFLRLKGERV